MVNATLIDNNGTWTDGQFGTNGVAAYVEFDNGWMADICNCSTANHCYFGGQPERRGLRWRCLPCPFPYTISSLFGTNDEAGIQSGLNPTTSDNILLQIPQTQQIITIFYYDDGTYNGWLRMRLLAGRTI